MNDTDFEFSEEVEQVPAVQPKMKKPWSRWTYLILAILIALLLAGFVRWKRARDLRWMHECQENLMKIDGEKEQWALKNNKSPGDPITFDELLDLPIPGNVYSSEWLRECPSGKGIYIANPVGTDPICTSGLPGHTLKDYEEWLALSYVTK